MSSLTSWPKDWAATNWSREQTLATRQLRRGVATVVAAQAPNGTCAWLLTAPGYRWALRFEVAADGTAGALEEHASGRDLASNDVDDIALSEVQIALRQIAERVRRVELPGPVKTPAVIESPRAAARSALRQQLAHARPGSRAEAALEITLATHPGGQS